MDLMHLYGRKPYHLENRDQVEMWGSLCIWTPNLPVCLAHCPAPGCKLVGQIVSNTHCLLVYWNSPCIQNNILRGVALKKKKKAFNINDLALIVMDILCEDTLPSRASRDKLSFSFSYAWREEWLRVQCHLCVYNNAPRLTEPHTTWCRTTNYLYILHVLSWIILNVLRKCGLLALKHGAGTEMIIHPPSSPWLLSVKTAPCVEVCYSNQHAPHIVGLWVTFCHIFCWSYCKF